jgi:hypothetical protein
MAIITSGNQRIPKPDVFDVIMGDFDAFETPLYNRLRKGPDVPDAKLFQFPFDVPDSPTNTGSAEGVEYTQAGTTTFGGRDLLYGRCHHQKNFFGVGEVAQGNEVYGTNQSDEFAYQMRRALRKMMKNAERVIIGEQEAQAGNGSTAYQTRGLELWLTDTANIAAQTDSSTVCPAAFRPAADQIVAQEVASSDYSLTEDQITDPFQSIYNALGSRLNLDVFCTTTFKSKVSRFGKLQADVSSFTAVRRFSQDAKDMKITATIDTYHGDCGTARFELHPFLRLDSAQKANALGLDMRYLQLRVRQAPKAEELPKAGGGRRGTVYQTFGLQCMPKYAAKWYEVDLVTG